MRAELIVRAKLVALGAESSYALWEDKPRWHELGAGSGQARQRRGHIAAQKRRRCSGIRTSTTTRCGSLDRPEVRGALSLVGASPGYASMVDGHLLVVAVPFSRADEVAGVARVALPLTEIDDARAELGQDLERRHRAGARRRDRRLDAWRPSWPRAPLAR